MKRLIKTFYIVLTFLSMHTYAVADRTEPEIVGDWLSGEIIATFSGFGRDEDGTLDLITVTFENESESTTYELLLDERLNQIAIQLWRNNSPLNDPFEGIEERMLGDLSLNLIKLNPGDTHVLDVQVSDFVDEALYEDLEEVSILFNLTIPIYPDGSDTAIDSSIGTMRVYMFPKSVPVVVE